MGILIKSIHIRLKSKVFLVVRLLINKIIDLLFTLDKTLANMSLLNVIFTSAFKAVNLSSNFNLHTLIKI